MLDKTISVYSVMTETTDLIDKYAMTVSNGYSDNTAMSKLLDSAE